MNSPVFEMEMERLDSEIEKTRKQFNSAVLGKKRRVKRTWLEISSLTNAHLLQTLPYRAMLGHVAKLTEERDKIIGEILERQEAEENEARSNSGNNLSLSSDSDFTSAQTHHTEVTFMTPDSSVSDPQKIQCDEAVQTEESSFAS